MTVADVMMAFALLGGMVGGYVKVDTSSADGLIKTAVDMFRALAGRDPTEEELAEMDASLASHSDISMDPLPVNPEASPKNIG